MSFSRRKLFKEDSSFLSRDFLGTATFIGGCHLWCKEVGVGIDILGGKSQSLGFYAHSKIYVYILLSYRIETMVYIDKTIVPAVFDEQQLGIT